MTNHSKATKPLKAAGKAKTGAGSKLPMMMITCAATVVMLGSSQAHAQSADALIDKLVAKGILTAKEGEDLRDESDKNFTTAFQTKMGMPDWVTSYKLGGDFRGRFEQYSSANSAMADRTRIRYRLRFGLTMNMLDNLETGFRLGSGDVAKGYTTATPLSNSSTFQDNFTKKDVFIDTAYGKWTAVNSGGWLVSGTVGKMDIPFSFTPMVLDQDLTPEGAVIQSAWNINDNQSLSLNGGAFVLDEELASVHDPFMYGGQFLWKAKWSDKLSTTLGVGGFDIVNQDQLITANVPLINQGNTRTITSDPITGADLYSLQYSYAPVILDASATYTLDSFPLYSGTFPIKTSGEFMQNLAVGNKNQGFWVGVTFGKSGTKNTWDISYRYERLEADAWYDQLVDDDNGAFYPGDRLTGTSPTVPFGYYGGTNIKGHLVKFDYSVTDSVTFTVTCYINDLISRDGLQPNSLVPDNKTSSLIHIMADINWLF